MKGSVLFIAVLIFLGVFTVFFNFYTDIQDNYGVVPTDGNYSEFQQSMETYSSNVYSLTQNQSDNTQQTGSLTINQGFGVITGGIWTAVKMPFYILPVFYSMVTEISTKLMIPKWIVNIILGIIVVVITYIILSAAFRMEL